LNQSIQRIAVKQAFSGMAWHFSSGASKKSPGDQIAVKIIRAGERRTLQLPMQE
jgi:hypothetical protein